MKNLAENPHLKHSGIAGLLGNMTADKNWSAGFEDQRLEAMAKQAENLRHEIPSYVQLLNKLIAEAADNEELSGSDIGTGAYFTVLLSELSAAVDLVEGEIKDALKTRTAKAA